MKKIFFCFFFIPVLAGPAKAQQTEPDRGIKGGITLARFTNTSMDTRTAPGFALGVFMEFDVAKSLSVQPEIIYTLKGSKVFTPSINTEFDLNLDYIEVPILINYKFPFSGIIKPRIFGGPYAAFLLNSNSNVVVSGDFIFTPDDLPDEANDTDWGAVVGFGTDFNFVFREVTFEARYSAGFSNAFNSSVSENIKNGVFSLLIGFSF